MWTSVSLCWTWLSLCAVLCVSEGEKLITADHGQTVTLSCEAPSNSSITAVEWTRPDLEPQYILLYKDDKYDTTHQSPSFKNWVELQDGQMKDGDMSKPGQKLITAEPGQTVTLPCKAPSNSPIIVVKWTRPDLGQEYVLLYKDKEYDPTRQSPSLKNRVELLISQMKDGDVSLVLKSVTTNDTGNYKCHIVQKETSRTKRATITEPISIINLEVEPGQKLITAEPGQTVTLPCKGPSNSPITAAEWTRPDLEPEYILLYRDKRYYPDNQHPSFKNRVELQDGQMKDGDVSLVLKNVTIEDEGKYKCHIFQRETSRRKRDTYDTEHIIIINLKVEPGPTAGGREGGGDTSGGREGGGDTSGGREGGGDTSRGRGHDGLTAGLLVAAGVNVAVSVFLLKTHKKKKNHDLVPPKEKASNQQLK